MKSSNLMVYILIALLSSLLTGGLLAHFYMTPVAYNLIICFTGFYTLACNGVSYIRLAGSSLLLALLMSLPFVVFDKTIITGFTDWVLLMPFVFYVLQTFHGAMHAKSGFNIQYSDLFYAGWNTMIVVLIAVLFALFVNGLLLLLTFMLESSGIKTYLVTESPWYLAFSKMGLLVIGVGIIRQHLHVVYATRILALALARIIYPIIILFSIIALIIYALADRHDQVLMSCLLAFFVLGLLFFNAVFQDGKALPAYPQSISPIVQVYPIILAFLGVILFFQSMEYLYTVKNTGLLASLILLYGAGYAVSCFLQEEKAIAWIKGTNVGLAIYFVIIALIGNSAFYTHAFPPAPVPSPALLSNPVSSDNMDIQPSPEQKAKLMALFGQHQEVLKKNGLIWKSFYPGRDKLPLKEGICQVPYKEGFEIGSIVENKCIITYGGALLPEEQFLYLHIANSKVHWQSASSGQALPLGLEFVPEQMGSAYADAFLRVLYACKVRLHGRNYFGKVVGNYCNIAWEGREKPMSNFRVLGKPL